VASLDPFYTTPWDTNPVSDDSLFIANLVLAFLSYLIDYPEGVPYDALAGAFPESPLRRRNGPFLPLKAGTEYYSRSYLKNPICLS